MESLISIICFYIFVGLIKTLQSSRIQPHLFSYIHFHLFIHLYIFYLIKYFISIICFSILKISEAFKTQMFFNNYTSFKQFFTFSKIKIQFILTLSDFKKTKNCFNKKSLISNICFSFLNVSEFTSELII